MRYGKRTATVGAFALLAGLALGGPAGAVVPAGPPPAADPVASAVKDQSEPQQGQTPQGAPQQSGSSKVLTPGSELPKGWNTSADQAVTVAGDGSGLHVLTAASSAAYQWRTVATLSEPGFSTDLWVGNVCVTGSGKRAVVVYGTREATNDPEMLQHGGFAAVVDLTTGKVTKLADTVTLAYFNPGCGTGERAVLTQLGDDTHNQTRLLTVDTTTGKVTHTVTEPGEITSAVPGKDANSTVGAMSGRLIGIDAQNRTTEVAKTTGPAFQLRADRDGGVDYLDLSGRTARAHRALGGTTTTFAQGPADQLGLHAGTGGRVFLTGKPSSTTALPASVTKLDAGADAVISSTGALAVDQAVSTGLRTHTQHQLAPTSYGEASPIQIQTHVVANGRTVPFTADPTAPETKAAAAGTLLSPALGSSGPAAKTNGAAGTAAPAAAGSPTNPIDTDRTCAVARNDPSQQAYQPTPNQVEWAADMAVRGDLTSTYVRQGGWRSSAGLGTVNPQSMFPLPGLTGAPTGRIPVQVLLGVLATESNLWQAEGGALPGQTSSTLTSINGFYGHPSESSDPLGFWKIDWTKTDCGYGIGQQTTGMKIGDVAELPANEQKAVALDYTSNIAIAAQTLEQKWNELHNTTSQPNTITLNDDNPAAPENWFAALWNYNSGYNKYNPADPSAPWGLGWLNNPDNPLYPPGRNAFLDNNSYADAGHPQDWSYAEKVLGWGAWPIDTGRAYADDGTANDSNTAGYSAMWWNSSIDRSHLKPLSGTFCQPDVNACDPTNPPRCEVDHLGETCDPPHWYHKPTGWKPDCATTCGNELMVYQTLRTELGNGNNGAAHMCDNTTNGFTVIDDAANSVPTYTDGCGKAAWSNGGSFSFNFNADTSASVTHYDAKGDLHQIGGGFGDHFWYAHTRDDAHGASLSLNDPDIDPGPASNIMGITGTWKLSTQRTSWSRVLVHLPDTGSATQQASYSIHLGDGSVHTRTINAVSDSNQWVDLGIYHFVSGSDFQGVALTNYSQEGQASNDVAWDAVGFQWMSAKPKHIVASLGDSYSSGEGAGSYDASSNQAHGTLDWNACRRSTNAWPRKLVLPGETASLGSLTNSFSTSADLGFVACSGSHTWQIEDPDGPYYPTGTGTLEGDEEGLFREIPEADSGVLTTNTTLVTITSGGNDGNAFEGAVEACALPTDCANDSSFLTKYEGIIDQTKADLASTLDTVAERASNAKIAVVGYPEILSPTQKCAGSADLDLDEVADLATLVHYLNAAELADVQALRDAGTDAGFINPVAAFAGHGGCDSTPWINTIVSGPNGDGDFHGGDPGGACIFIPGLPASTCLSRESFHPNSAGTTGYADAVENGLGQLGYTGG